MSPQSCWSTSTEASDLYAHRHRVSDKVAERQKQKSHSGTLLSFGSDVSNGRFFLVADTHCASDRSCTATAPGPNGVLIALIAGTGGSGTLGHAISTWAWRNGEVVH